MSLEECKDISLNRNDSSVQVGLIFGKEWLEMCVVDVCRALKNKEYLVTSRSEGNNCYRADLSLR